MIILGWMDGLDGLIGWFRNTEMVMDRLIINDLNG